MILFQSGYIQAKRLTEADSPLLVKWLSDVRVLEYYEQKG